MREDGVLVKVARLYYEDGLTQEELAKRFGASRSTISRLLEEARGRGLVRIVTADVPGAQFYELERQIEQTFGLLEAIVVEAPSERQAVQAVGRAGADYLLRLLRSDMVIGISWGRTLAALCEAVSPRASRAQRVTVVPLTGGAGQSQPELHANSLAVSLARRLHGRWVLLHAPAIVASQEIRDAVISDASVAGVLAQGRAAQVVLAGIGALHAWSTLVQAQYLTPDDVQELARCGAVGDICSRFFDSQGKPVQSEVDRRTIGIDLESLRQIPRRVGLAAGSSKVQAVLGALRGGFVNVLIADLEVARGVLAAASQDSGGGAVA